MTSIDTNVVVRLVTRDDPEQAERATEIFAAGPLWLGKTVLLETEWVLRYSYRLDRDIIHETFRRLLGYPLLEAEDRATVVRALGWHGEGMDFADALHLASSDRAERFVTFDGDLVAAAAELETTPEASLA